MSMSGIYSYLVGLNALQQNLMWFLWQQIWFLSNQSKFDIQKISYDKIVNFLKLDAWEKAKFWLLSIYF